MSPMAFKGVALAHLVLLGVWAGVVAAEAVLELYPRRRPELHSHTVRFHYWIDLLVELPVILGVALSGMVLLLHAWPPTLWHVVKVCCGCGAVLTNLVCIALVIKRHRMLRRGEPDTALWSVSRRITLSATAGIPLALVAAAIGLWLASQRMV